MSHYTHNSNLHYYMTHESVTNCGSFALRTEEWYDPDGSIGWASIEDWVREGFSNGLERQEMSNLFLDRIVEQVLYDFNDIRVLFNGNEDEVKDNEELIALRVFANYDFDDDWADWDFHFKVLRDGRWQEKNGDSEVHYCDLEDWSSGCLDYISDTVFFAKKIQFENLTFTKNSDIIIIENKKREDILTIH